MRSTIASAILAGFLVLTPVAAGYAPASSQDFSITNPDDFRVEGAVLGPDWIRKLQQWWDLHAYYPRKASENNESGIVKLHLLIHPNGEVFLLKVVQGSGSGALDRAAFWTFHNMHLQPFPPGTPAPQADVYISLHYVLTHRHGQPVAAVSAPASPKPAFTITNDPPTNTVVAKWLQRICTGWVVAGGWRPDDWRGVHRRVTAIFYRKPNGAPWVEWWGRDTILRYVPVAELGVSAQWSVVLTGGGACGGCQVAHFAVWPAGDNGLSGTFDSGGGGLNSAGSIDLTCKNEVVPAIISSTALEVPEGAGCRRPSPDGTTDVACD